MADPLSTYVAADREYRTKAVKLAEIINAVLPVAHHLEHRPEQFSFTGISSPVPPQLAMGRRSSADAGAWPTAEEIQQAVFEWHEAYSKALDAWGRIPPEDQQSLKEPDKPSSNVRYTRSK